MLIATSLSVLTHTLARQLLVVDNQETTYTKRWETIRFVWFLWNLTCN